MKSININVNFTIKILHSNTSDDFYKSESQINVHIYHIIDFIREFKLRYQISKVE